jgi:protein phosphatase
LANENGGRDNITVVVVDIVGDERTDGVAVSATKRRVADMAGFETALDHETVLEGTTVRAAVAEPAPAAHASQEIREPRPPIFTVRTVLFLFAFVLVVLIAVGAVYWIGRRTYYVAFNDADQVVIYRGRPGGVLWIEPTEAEVAADLNRAQIPESLLPTLDKGHDVSSLEAGRRYLFNVRQEVSREATFSETAGLTTTTTTTVPASTVPAAPATSTPDTTPTATSSR